MDPDVSSPSIHLLRSRTYWRRNLLVVSILLTIWAVVAFLISIVLAGPLNEFTIAGFPLGFWMAQQGATIVFVLLVLIYCVTMRQLDRYYGVNE